MLTPQEVSTHTFTKSFSGYNMAMVDEFLDELTDDYTKLYKENQTLKAKMKVMAEKVEEYRATEDSMRATLMTAQRVADEIVQKAEAKRDEMLDNVEKEVLKRSGAAEQEVLDLEERMRQSRSEMAQFIAAARELCARELKFLEQLPQMPVETPAPQPKEFPAPEMPGAVEDLPETAPVQTYSNSGNTESVSEF